MKGSYLLLMELSKDRKISVGKLGEIEFKKGIYVYVGSALNGIENRLNRHLRKNKKLHWHIDYLLKNAEIIDILYNENDSKQECFIAKQLNDKLSIISGFGCSDCRCKSHLFYGSYKQIKDIIAKLDMKPYLKNAKYKSMF